MRPLFDRHRYASRARTLYAVLLCALLALSARLVQLHVFHQEFLQQQSKIRSVHTVALPSYRGVICDRHHVPLAISTPMMSVWLDPQRFAPHDEDWQALSQSLGLSVTEIMNKHRNNLKRSFVYLKHNIPPDVATQIMARNIRGVHTERGYRRFYPLGEDVAQLVGFTNIDDAGQEGLEAFFEATLQPHAGRKQVVEDRSGTWLKDVALLAPPQSGDDVILSLDARIQSHMMHVLNDVIATTEAKAATAVMVHIQSGEILAIGSAPSFNPNQRNERIGAATRLKAMTDPIEPGSTIKPFTLIAALEAGTLQAQDTINTDPGFLRLGQHTIRDPRNYGTLSLTEVLMRSSNVALGRIALDLPPHTLYDLWQRLGVGRDPSLALPGAHSGVLRLGHEGDPALRISMSFGYGFSMTPVQLAHAFATLGAKGLRRDLTLLKKKTLPVTQRVFSEEAANTVLAMLTQATSPQGTGRLAAIPGYPTAGKTGTVRVVGPQGYDKNRHIAMFAGITPMPHPQLATVVIVEEPQKRYYGGQTAAPAYAAVVRGGLHLLNIPPAAP